MAIVRQPSMTAEDVQAVAVRMIAHARNKRKLEGRALAKEARDGEFESIKAQLVRDVARSVYDMLKPTLDDIMKEVKEGKGAWEA